VLVQTLENFDDGKKSYALKETKKTALSWTGNKFIEVK